MQTWRSFCSLPPVALLPLVVLAGCGQPSSCPEGHSPIVGECRQGLTWIDCGGEGPPRFACGEAGGCVWLTTSCVPEGYRATDCPETDPCCHRDADGSWPYPDHWRPPAPASAANMVEDIAAFGGAALTAMPDITVRIDPSLPEEEPSVLCDPGVDRELCALGAPTVIDLWNGFALWSSSNLPGAEHFWMEISVVRETSIGRAYLRVAPVDEVDGAPSCELARTRPSTTPITGTVLLRRFDLESPEDLHGRAELLIDGGRVTFTF
jgi:hypothetical protein